MEQLHDDYYKWLISLVCEHRFYDQISYDKLLRRLHEIDFRYLLPRDGNREHDGRDLRRRFALSDECPYEISLVTDILAGPSSVLEMMVALAVRCEEFMDDISYGNRVGQWFWTMVVNLGLGAMSDARFDKEYVDETIQIFLNRDYAPDGRGGLFWIRDCEYDLRSIEIWVQLSWYLLNVA